ncbi:MAG: cytochrome b5 domain-containing protein [Candidatus Accumulibacter phosphatis]|uniref:Cytochrome b5 domain-containing protein n=2 Tax=Candidatus Accumulibacter TaxID=327159 RepID=A0A080M4T1_9PROT|nr:MULTISPECIES: cytochrome b5 domain-containing protein [Candidatus Accumulibacter]KFB76208.1 MAG: Soluble cytochrome b558 [Candidatus Accumulibacter cognatus]MBL8401659.1 cytochrome b5 domain-containing protein [Accumulibacter sp.]MBO3709973.1 cytochrome b5 domain-containing protein [Accumulibacter sp.]MCC2867621.1 cytochrome b5 domain-containing protein [Candidatus Accumulibacter phosphatis]MCM8580454.1 cytochrome b5 domain-containing protein [Accumulibacter sp.]
MTRKLFVVSTIAFWIAVTGLGTTSVWWLPTGQASAQAREKIISPADLAKHTSPENCWMAIRGAVYDLSTYLPEHPSRPDIVLPWCGKEASEAYNTKMKGRPHSPYADELLAKYRIGSFAKVP